MSAIRSKNCTVRYRLRWSWSLDMIPWYRQLLALVFGCGVMLIALWGIDQGTGTILIITVAGMAFLTLLLIFGVELDSITYGEFNIDFTNTSVSEKTRIRSSDYNNGNNGDDDK